MKQASASALTAVDIEETMESLRNVCEEDLCLDGIPGEGGDPVEGSEPSHDQGAFRVLLPVLELFIGLLLLGGAIFYLMEAYALPKPYNPMDIGAGGFPKLLGLGTLIFMGLMLAIACYHLVVGGKKFGTVTVSRPLFVVLATLVMVVQACFFEELGTVACVGLASLLVMLVCGERRLVHLIGIPAALVGFIYVVFVLALNVNLP